MMPRVVDDPPSPGTPEWGALVTASKIPTILGLNPFETRGELWMRMSGHAPWPTPTPEQEAIFGWGHDAEDSLVKYWLRRNPGWQAGRSEVAYTDDSLPFPNLVTLDRRARRGRRHHIIECKTSGSYSTWAGGVPPHVTAQVITQMGISGIHEATVVAQVGSTVPTVVDIPWDADVFAGIVDAASDFHASLGEYEPPMPPDDLLEALKPVEGRGGEATIDDVDSQVLLDLLAQKAGIEARIKAEIDELVSKYGADKLRCGGKLLVTTKARRFGVKNLPDEVKHLAIDERFQKESTVTRFDAKAFQEAYPEVYELGFGDIEHEIGKEFR